MSGDWMKDPKVLGNVMRELETQLRPKENGGLVSIIGFGALLSKASASRTFPDLSGFRFKLIKGWRRVFGHPALIYFERGIANPDTKEVADLSIESDESSCILVSVFEVNWEELPKLFAREDEFRYVPVPYYDLVVEDSKLEGVGVACSSYNDDDTYVREKLNGSWDMFLKIWGAWGIKKVWSGRDLLPCRVYLRHCFLAIKRVSEEHGDESVLRNFLETTLLADRCTTLKEYLAKNPMILEEEPPEHLKAYYSG